MIDWRNTEECVTTSRAARLLQVTPATVAHWADQGKLKAGRTAGGHRRVAVSEVVRMLRRQRLPLPTELARWAPAALLVSGDRALTAAVRRAVDANHPTTELLVAKDPFAAGEIVGAKQPSLVVLDLDLRAVDGEDFCHHLAARPLHQRPHVCAVSGPLGKSRRARLAKAGVARWMTKPVNADLLAREFLTALGQ